MEQNKFDFLRLDDSLQGDKISLRLLKPTDYSENYLSWLNNSLVNQYLETRWSKQTSNSIRSFISSMLESNDNFLFAIIEKSSQQHIGNLKLGPINYFHKYADISYFIGNPDKWSKGYASEGINLATDFGFNTLKLHRIQAGLYESNVASSKALEKAGFIFETKFINQLLGAKGWEDHLWYVKFKEE